MPDPDTGEILWYNPDPRAVVPLDQFHISRSLRKTAKKGVFSVTFDSDFAAVVDGCADRQPTWISPEIKAAYVRLFDLGFGHSVEVRNSSGELVGGLYGLAQAGVFNAESMFSRQTDASKVAIWALIKRMQECGMGLLEVQFMTPHLKSLGAIEISKDQYIRELGIALKKPVGFNAVEGSYKFL